MITLAVTGLVTVFFAALAVALWALTEDKDSYTSRGELVWSAFVVALTFTGGLSVLWLGLWLVARMLGL